jgi:hypothetical protein
MATYHATLLDECGDEFGVTMELDDGVESVTEYFRDMYPESSIVCIEPAGGPSTSRAQAETRWLRLDQLDQLDLY